mmetsp:Transcript_105807/g.207526  ORF Transcript_105807/g.207526 Transcript_105807/m.207526 type:complete len:328 (+) Transcript_105807:248-1231(+)
MPARRGAAFARAWAAACARMHRATAFVGAATQRRGPRLCQANFRSLSVLEACRRDAVGAFAEDRAGPAARARWGVEACDDPLLRAAGLSVAGKIRVSPLRCELRQRARRYGRDEAEAPTLALAHRAASRGRHRESLQSRFAGHGRCDHGRRGGQALGRFASRLLPDGLLIEVDDLDLWEGAVARLVVPRRWRRAVLRCRGFSALRLVAVVRGNGANSALAAGWAARARGCVAREAALSCRGLRRQVAARRVQGAVPELVEKVAAVPVGPLGPLDLGDAGRAGGEGTLGHALLHEDDAHPRDDDEHAEKVEADPPGLQAALVQEHDRA